MDGEVAASSPEVGKELLASRASTMVGADQRRRRCCFPHVMLALNSRSVAGLTSPSCVGVCVVLCCVL
jgi:hypothetical protein